MDEKCLQRLENLCISIDFEDKVYDFLYLFNYAHDMSILNPVPYEKENRNSIDENDKLEEEEIRQGFERFKGNSLDIIHLIKLVDEENYINLGMCIARYYSQCKFDEILYREMVTIAGIEQIILNYISCIYRNGDKSVINQAKSLSKNYDGKDTLYVNILKIEILTYEEHPLIMDEEDHIKQLYWSERIRRFLLSEDKDTIQWVLSELKNYDNVISYIECLYEGLKIFKPEEVLGYMIDLKEFKNFDGIDQSTKYYLNEIIDSLENNFEGKHEKYHEIMYVEILFRGLIDWDKMKSTQYLFKNDPSYYAEIVDIIYLHEGEEKNNRTKEQSRIAESFFDFYYKALFCPCENSGDIDLNELKEWVQRFKDKLKKQKQLNLFGHELGRLFAYSPAGKDGYYPHESIREVIEELKDESLKNSYIIAERNKRGVYSPNAGKTEKEMALRYKENADQIRIQYSESAKIFDDLHKSYYYDSEAERRRAEDEW